MGDAASAIALPLCSLSHHCTCRRRCIRRRCAHRRCPTSLSVLAATAVHAVTVPAATGTCCARRPSSPCPVTAVHAVTVSAATGTGCFRRPSSPCPLALALAHAAHVAAPIAAPAPTIVRPLLTQQSLRPSLLLCGCTGHRACTHCAPVAVPTPVLHPSLSKFSEPNVAEIAQV